LAGFCVLVCDFHLQDSAQVAITTRENRRDKKTTG